MPGDVQPPKPHGHCRDLPADARDRLEINVDYGEVCEVVRNHVKLSETDLGRIDTSDFVHAVSLVATIGEGGGEVIIGGGAYTVLERPGEPATAEVSFTIEEDYQGQGLAGLFMRLLTQIGRERGIVRFEAEVLAGNVHMLKVFQRSGLPMHAHIEEGVVHVVMELGGAEPPLS